MEWMISALARSVATFPAWMLHYITLAWGTATPNAQVSTKKDKWPVIVFSHGLIGGPFPA
jgi:Zn-dependent protease with chaperone function